MSSFQAELTRLKTAGRYRALRPRAGIDLSSNDYLALSGHPDLRRAAVEALEGGLVLGSGGSRLLSGHHDAHADLEAFAARHFGVPRALYFATGFQANYALTTTLIGRHDVAIFDALSHASLRDGLHAVHGRAIKVRHNDLDGFEAALRRPRDARAFVLVESAYSMDGDLAPVADLLRLCERYDATLIVDEAHGTGVLGATGKGLTEGLASERLITLHTCGKALGVAGALVCAGGDVIDYLINRARPFIYSTAPMPLQALLTQKALQIAAREGWGGIACAPCRPASPRAVPRWPRKARSCRSGSARTPAPSPWRRRFRSKASTSAPSARPPCQPEPRGCACRSTPI